jgi:aryl-alcohol dehydrogenase-like predicted oxidoreductase
MQALALQQANGWARFVSMQNHLNLIYREEEREMLPLCRAEGVGVIPWSPLARGRLTRPPETQTTRSGSDRFGEIIYRRTAEADRAVIDRLGEAADARGLPRAQLALAWLLAKPGVTAPIIGATKLQHLSDAVAAVELKLSAEEIKALEAPYVPHPVSGFV